MPEHFHATRLIDRPLRINTSDIGHARLDEYFGAPWAIHIDVARSLLLAAEKFNLRLHAENHKPRGVAGSQGNITTLSNPSPMRSGRIAVIDMHGVMMKQVSSIDEDACSTVRVRRELRAAANDDSITAIILHIYSPGGTIAGTADLARDVLDARERKPVYAFCEDLCASAAYWVASQCDAVYANQSTCLVGSIGTYIALYDFSKAFEDAGIEALVIKARNAKLKGTGVLGSRITDEQRSYLQQTADDLQTHFDAAVITGRGFDEDQLAAVSTGGVFIAADALSLGLIDNIQNFDAVVEEAFAPPSQTTTGASTMSKPSNDQTTKPNADTTGSEQTNAATAEAAGQGRENASDSRPAGKPLATSQDKPAADDADDKSTASAEVAQDANDTANNADAEAQSKPNAETGADETGGPAATLTQLNEALPKASADFKLKCLEDGVTLSEAQTRYIAEVEASNAKLEQRLTGAPRGSDEPVTVDDADAPAPSAEDAKLDAAVGPNVARFARGLKLQQGNPQNN